MMPPAGTRKRMKARRRAIIKPIINSTSSSDSSSCGATGTVDVGKTTTTPCCRGNGKVTPFTTTTKENHNFNSGCGQNSPSVLKKCGVPPYTNTLQATSTRDWEALIARTRNASTRVYEETTENLLNERPDDRKSECAVCGVLTPSCCSACGKVYYCGKTHQKKHWNEGHKFVCFPYEEMEPWEHVREVGPLGKGRYLKASKDIPPMEKIYEDHSIMTGPGCCADLRYEPVCLGCTDRIQDHQKCSICKWPLCGPKCEKGTLHSKYECDIFADNRVKELNDRFQYELVRILRCLLTKNKDPAKFKQLMALDGAFIHRRALASLIEATKTACMFVKENCKLAEFDDETINHMCGVVDLQTQPSGKDRSSMQIFEFPTKLLHSCSANTRFLEVIGQNGENILQIVAVRPIKKGEPITQRLVISMEPTYERQKFLREHYYFQCHCDLCEDPSERSTNFSSVTCLFCSDGEADPGDTDASGSIHYILPKVPSDLSTIWACNFCQTEFSSAMMLAKLDRCENAYWTFKYGTLQEMRESDKVAAIRQKISNLEKEFHPNNYFVWRLKQLLFNKLTENILLIYPPSSWDEFRAMYTEIERLACCIMASVHLLQPGFTLIRGRTLHDLITAHWGYIQWAVLFGKASSFKNHRDSQDFFSLVEEAVAIFEPEVTEIKKVIDSVRFMRDHVEEIRLRLQYLGQLSKLEKVKVNDFSEERIKDKQVK